MNLVTRYVVPKDIYDLFSGDELIPKGYYTYSQQGMPGQEYIQATYVCQRVESETTLPPFTYYFDGAFEDEFNELTY
jgi:hypothetical protein